METNTYTPAQVAYAEQMFAKMVRPTSDHESLMEMCLRLAETTITNTEVDEKPETVSRTYKCLDCGSRDDRTLTIEWDIPRNAKGLQNASWCCDDCGATYANWIRMTKKD